GSARLIALHVTPSLRLSRADIRNLRQEDLKKAKGAAASFGVPASNVEPVPAHPFRQCQVDGWTAQRHQETSDALAEALGAIAA
ncbi:hypothetical protein, partial [Lactococcus petauri]|uniref:hypothetical protein n=1 Tax=Lactococcus petauri TaxID=1940789 RepID=UPI0021F17094